LYYSSDGPKMTTDGSLVLFVSNRPDVVNDGPRPGRPHLYLRNIANESTKWVTSALEPALGIYSNDFQIIAHAISANGAAIGFKVALAPSSSIVWMFRYD